MANFTYRTESKHVVSFGAIEELRARLRATLAMDEHAIGRPYVVKSLYFDSPADSALQQCLDGDPVRIKYRLRYYDNDTTLIKLEKKVKCGALGYKLSATVDRTVATRLIEGETHCIADRTETALQDFQLACATELLRPAIVMEYLREAYVFPVENTRVTIDYRLRTYVGYSDFTAQFFNYRQAWVTQDDLTYLVEVKYDRFLPDIIRALVSSGETGRTSNSKYLLGRLATCT